MRQASSAKAVRQVLPMAVMGVVFSTGLFAIVFSVERDASQGRFHELAEQRLIAIRANIAIAQDSVNLLVGHFAVAPPGSTSREGFRLMVCRSLDERGFIQGFSWDPRVRHAERGAYEDRTPVQYVGDNIVFMKEGIASLLDLDFLEAELPAAATQALDGTGHIAKIVQAIKAFSYPSSKSAHPIDLNHMIDVVSMVTRNQWKYVAQMECDLAPDLPKVLAVGGEINQVLVNLVVNAAQAIAEKGDLSPGRITVRTRNLGQEVELTVADTGSGIPPGNLKQVFEMFFTTKAPGKGTGQGLAISRAIIHRHGGQISVESEPGSGACFHIRLPLAETQGV